MTIILQISELFQKARSEVFLLYIFIYNNFVKPPTEEVSRMCCVKTGDDIKCVQDVQNLITGVILRQRHTFNREYLLKATKFYMPQDEKVAASIASDDDISEMIDETLAILHSNGFVVCIDGKYHNARSLL